MLSQRLRAYLCKPSDTIPFTDCGDGFENGGTNTTLSDCNTPCTGNSSEICGAGGRLSMYWSGVQPPAPPITAPSVGAWVSLGCYK